MTRLNQKSILVGCLLSAVVLNSCDKDFLERDPIGQISESTLANKTGVNGLLIGAYSLLDGVGTNQGNTYDLGIWNSMVSGAASDDAHKGGGYGSQIERLEIERKSYTATNPILNDKWRAYYAGAQRANEVLRVLAKVPAGAFTDGEAQQVRAEARFLRAVYHLEAAKMWRNVPYVDETIFFNAGNYNLTNTEPIWPKIEADFQFAVDNLTPTKAQIGRANSWAAKAFLAKVYLFQQKFAEAKPLLEDLIANGVTAGGIKYGLLPEFGQIYQATFENGAESVFAVQMSVKDGGEGHNGNEGEAWNVPGLLGGWAHQPSFSLVNSFKTENGLPLIYTWNDFDVKNDQAIGPTDPFIPYEGPLDPRLDWTVGRRDIPYLDWGLYQQAWCGDRAQGGPYSPIKTVHWKKDTGGKSSDMIDGWLQATGQNYYMIRFADVLLWAAETEVEIGSLQKAEEYVNLIRRRAANPASFRMKYRDDTDPSKGFSTVPAANYQIALYNGAFAARGKDFARESVRFERKLELAMEGHRFFDLQRYNAVQPGYMADVLNRYSAHETATYKANLKGVSYLILEGARFIQGKHEIYAIPQAQIDLTKEGTQLTLTQNPGH
ncbi:MAG: RagB/SusD family nutrient uptake outer membrane protein [Ferruginibacter sp.]|nr:RagB/SusD family nutrient uptake outer membrane protein [Cytophagales bacterium]